MRKPRLFELDIVRAVAITAVLLIHGTASATVDLPLGRMQVLYKLVNSLSYYAVFLFIFLSGLVLFYSYMDSWNFRQIFTFYRKRLQYIVLPYLIWAVFYYLYNPAVTPGWGVEWNWPVFLKQLVWGETGYHLYFMIIIVQFYALFPIVVSLAKVWSGFRRYLWVFGLAVQIGAYLFHLYIAPMEHRVTWFFTYFGLFCIGGSIGMYYDRFLGWLNRNIWWVPAVTVALGMMYAGLTILGQYGITYGQHLFELTFNSYALFVGLSSIWIGRHLLTAAPRLAKLLSSMGAASFGIYFIHPAVQLIWMNEVQASPLSSMYHAVTWGGILLIFTVPWLIVWTLKRVKGSWVLFGK